MNRSKLDKILENIENEIEKKKSDFDEEIENRLKARGRVEVLFKGIDRVGYRVKDSNKTLEKSVEHSRKANVTMLSKGDK